MFQTSVFTQAEVIVGDGAVFVRESCQITSYLAGKLGHVVTVLEI